MLMPNCLNQFGRICNLISELRSDSLINYLRFPRPKRVNWLLILLEFRFHLWTNTENCK